MWILFHLLIISEVLLSILHIIRQGKMCLLGFLFSVSFFLDFIPKAGKIKFRVSVSHFLFLRPA